MIETSGRRKEKKLYHINLLKKRCPATGEATAVHFALNATAGPETMVGEGFERGKEGEDGIDKDSQECPVRGRVKMTST